MSANILDFTYTNKLVPRETEFFNTQGEDMSQLGRRRNRFLSEHQLPIVDGVTVVGVGLAKNPVFRIMFPSTVNWGDNVNVMFTYNNTTMGSFKEGIDNINDLRESLRPTNIATNKDIWAHGRVQERVRIIREQRPIDLARFAAQVTKQLASDVALYEYLAGNNLIEEDTSTITTARRITPEEIDRLSFSDLTNVVSKLIEPGEDVMNSFRNLEYAALRKILGDSEALSSHPSIQSSYSEAKTELMSRHTALPIYWKNFFGQGSRIATDPVTVTIGGVRIEPTINKTDSLNEFAYFSLFLQQAGHPNMERNYEFAFTRMLTVKYGLLGDSDERCEMDAGPDADLKVDVNDFSWYLKTSRKPELLVACIYTSAISFLKSGHHATAANLDNTLWRIAGSLGFNITLEQARDMIAPAVYHGPHPASMRVLYAYLLHRNARENVTGAIAYRLHPAPPTSMAFTNLELFVESLKGARYFEIMDRQPEYDAFKLAMEEIRATMWYTCPYSQYLFGETRPEPTRAKEIASRLAGYAAALDNVMPTSTLRLSPSLKKLATQVGANQIASQLLVESYVAGFRRYYRYFTENKFRVVVARPGMPQALLE